ncbi:hypothetical protein PF005_g945 [Phytophthora fragariae]|nr:hypothetical protein PF003_g27069 [Phytophthora fragariae]KAE8945365.1 hypothetical protein PF009_g4982 [Phytophthora fragariae]KAE9029133.1 hypothetical protein PF011_g1228 [Phytophthora fragariae]KAE9129444.1 hypothetical protein PF007_g4886 [Phytophthora fragariae]KAE9137161.1 hypothetical protein PF010_g1410 [Phytophthora fragariae]
MAFFEEQEVSVMDWPARSPNLNPIENLWTIMARKVYPNDRQYSNVGELTTAISAAWSSIEQATLVMLMSQCLDAALK